MTLQEIYTFCHPLIDVLGTLSLIVLTFGSTLLAITWFVKKYWKILVAAGVMITVVLFMKLALALP